MTRKGMPTAPAPSSESLDAEALFRRHAQFVAGFVARLGFSGQDVDDIVQEVFLVAHRRGGYTPGPARPTTWLAEIAVRTAMSHRRASKKSRPVTEPDMAENIPASAASPSDNAQSREALALAQAALEQLDLERRSVFVLYELEGESCEAIATAMGIPTGTVYSRLHTARREFLEAYQRLTAERGRPIGRGSR